MRKLKQKYNILKNNNMRGVRNFKFKVGQEVRCFTLRGYGGEVLVKNRTYTVNFVGVNVIGFEQHVTDDGTPIKFFNHYFEEVQNNIKRIFRKGDLLRYKGCNWTVIEQLGVNLFLSYNGGGAEDVCINILTDEYVVSKHKVKFKDKVTLVPLNSIQRNLDNGDNKYYFDSGSVDLDVMHTLYRKLENIDSFTVSKACERTGTVCLKGSEGYLFPFEMIVPLKEHVMYNPIVIGSKIVYKKGRFAIIDKEYIVKEIVKLSSKTILGLEVDNGLIYVNKKECKNTKVKNEKKMVKKELKDIF